MTFRMLSLLLPLATLTAVAAAQAQSIDELNAMIAQDRARVEADRLEVTRLKNAVSRDKLAEHKGGLTQDRNDLFFAHSRLDADKAQLHERKKARKQALKALKKQAE